VTPSGGVIVAVDPGRDKCGLVVLAQNGEVLARDVVAVSDLPRRVAEECAGRAVRTIVVGGGTGGEAVKTALFGALAAEAVEILAVPEPGTTRAARKIYFQYNPPRGWRRLLPSGLRVPPEPVDGYAAEAIGRRYLGLEEAPGSANERLKGLGD
jgi:hypothetical protein